MEKKIFKTRIKQGLRLSDNDYVKGRIYGIATALTFSDEDIKEYAIRRIPGVGTVYTMQCNDETYELFKKIVERDYCNLCEFYYGEAKDE